MSAYTPEPDRALLAALVPAKHQQKYMTNAAFHSKVILLAQLIPEWIDGMAALAEAEDIDRHKQFMRLMAGQPLNRLDETKP